MVSKKRNTARTQKTKLIDGALREQFNKKPRPKFNDALNAVRKELG
jgi:hypothetical protein